MAEQIPKRIGPFEVVEKLGRGGMAIVYKAIQTSLNRTVAVKVLARDMSAPPAAAERFHREAHAVAMLNHPNVVQIIDKGEEDGVLYFAMEYVEGDSLDAVMQQRRLSFAEALRVFKEVCKGLEYAHQQKIIHRDLNPRNILVSPDLATVKLADFGICRVEALSRSSGTLSTSEVSMGTLHYLAPEQATDMVTADHRSDIFSLGVLFYEMLTGTVPVGRFSLPSRLNREVPPGLDPIILKCLATNPNDRYQSVQQVMAAVQKLEESLRLRLVDELKGISRSTGKIFRRSTQTFGHKRGLLTVAVIAGVIAVAALAYILVSTGKLSAWLSPPPSESVEIAGAEPADANQPAADSTDGPAADEPPAGGSRLDTPASQSQSQAANDRTQPPPAQVAARAVVPSDGAALQAARSKFESGLSEPALAEVESILRANDKSPAQPEALFLRGEILEKLGRNEDAIASYAELSARFTGHERETEAMFRRAELIRAVRKPGWEQEALDLFSAVAEHRDSPLAPPALAREGEIQAKLGLKVLDPSLQIEVPETLITYRRLVTDYPNAPASEFAYWSLANLYRGIGQDRLAAETLENLGARFPNNRVDAWWEAAEIYEKKLDDAQRAQDAYARVPASSGNYDKAQKRLKKLDQ